MLGQVRMFHEPFPLIAADPVDGENHAEIFQYLSASRASMPSAGDAPTQCHESNCKSSLTAHEIAFSLVGRGLAREPFDHWVTGTGIDLLQN